MKWFLLRIYRHITINNTERMNIDSNCQHVFYSLHRLLLLHELRQCMSDYIDSKKQHTLNILLNSSCSAYQRLRPPNSDIFVTAFFWHESAQSVHKNLSVNPLTDTALFWRGWRGIMECSLFIRKFLLLFHHSSPKFSLIPIWSFLFIPWKVPLNSTSFYTE